MDTGWGRRWNGLGLMFDEEGAGFRVFDFWKELAKTVVRVFFFSKS